jgi:glycosyltransferase involved in cell wall biosynthesis
MPLKNKKIGIFTAAWDFGGLCSFCQILGHGLARQGYEVTFILARGFKQKDRWARQAFEALKRERLGSILDLRLQYVPRSLRAGYMKERIARRKFDVVILNNADSFLDIFHEISESSRLISVTHGDLSSGTYVAFAQTQHFCHRHIAISSRINENLRSMCPPSQHASIALIRHGVAQCENPPTLWDDSMLRVIYAGRLDFTQKRIRDIADIWKLFLAKGGQGILSIVGAGEEEIFLHGALAGQIARGTVVMHGYKDRADVPGLLRQSEVILNLSNWEGLPLSILEGMANGCYPVLSDIPSGHSDIISLCGAASFLTGDTARAADFLRNLSSDKKNLYQKRLAAWRQSSIHFSETAMLEQYREIIDTL